MKANHFACILLIATLSAGSVWAHPGHDEHVSGFIAGLAHPLLGVDHLLAMLAVGMWGARIGGKALWGAPLAFMVSMGAGAMLAFAGVGVPFVEPLVAASVLVLGLALATRMEMPKPVPKAAPFVLVAAFAVFHGLAHGVELPQGAVRMEYLAGFMLSTGAIHVAGVAVMLLIGAGFRGVDANPSSSRLSPPDGGFAPTLRLLTGVPIALAGAWLLAGAV